MNNNSNKKQIGYIVMPMDLTDRQTIIYIQLYKRCNFQDMTVSYTRDQLAADIKIIDIPPITIYKDIKAMISKGYLEIIKKGSKGTPTTYKIKTMKELKNGTIKEQYQNKIRTIKPSNSNGSDGEAEHKKNRIRTIKEHPIKEKEKENIYNDFYKKIKELYPGKKSKVSREKQIPKILKKYSEDEILECIKNYSKEVSNIDKQYILRERTFWNGRYIDYLTENYEEETTKQDIKQELIYSQYDDYEEIDL